MYIRGADASPTAYDIGIYHAKSSSTICDKKWVAGATTGSWHHIALTRTGGVLYLYKNGVSLGVQAVGTEIGSNDFGYADKTFVIATDTHYHALYKGYMDEFAVYKGIAKYNPVALPGQATITPSYLSDPSGNHFTTSGLAITDQMLDTPENNFSTLNPLTPADDNPCS
jgi:hypothetical protein